MSPFWERPAGLSGSGEMILQTPIYSPVELQREGSSLDSLGPVDTRSKSRHHLDTTSD